MRAKIIVATFALLAIIVAGFVFLTWRYQKFKREKIEFILWDRNHANVAGLSEAELMRYILACGATARTDEKQIHISYDTTFVRKTWTIERHVKGTEPQR
jgi:hypothetical protein